MSEITPTLFEFFVDGQKHTTEKAHLTGLEIKTLSRVEGAFQLFLEEEGEKPDRPIPDSETVSLNERICHFFAVPPATFGSARHDQRTFP